MSAITAVALTASLGFAAGMVVSPSQRAAMASPPALTAATALVEERVLSQVTVARGELRFPNQKTVAMPSATGVVTHTWLKPGKRVSAGSLLFEVNNHPVVALRSPFSPFRDLKAGSSGRDVQVVKSSLRSMGLRVSGLAALQSFELSSLDRFLRTKGYHLPVVTSECPEDTGDSGSAKPCSPSRQLTLPASWWVGIKSLPAVVAKPGPRVGAALGGDSAALTVSAGSLTLDVTFPGETIDVSSGSKITFSSDSGDDLRWTVGSVQQLHPDDPAGAQIRIHIAEPVDASLVDLGGKVTFGSDEPSRSLAVPLTALTTGAAGGVVVRVVQADGRWEEIPVEVGVQASGWAAVTDLSGRLHVGQEVVLG